MAKDWKARIPKTLTTAEFPGTAVDWDGAIYEVLEAQALGDGGMRYRLAPWPPHHVFRRLEHYDAASEEGRRLEQAERARNQERLRTVVLLSPLTGLLPGEVQRKMALDFGAPAVLMTIVSSVYPFCAGVLGVFAHLARRAGAGLGWPVWVAPPFWIAAYLLVESGLRASRAFLTGEPMGTLPAELIDAFRRALFPTPR